MGRRPPAGDLNTLEYQASLIAWSIFRQPGMRGWEQLVYVVPGGVEAPDVHSAIAILVVGHLLGRISSGSRVSGTRSGLATPAAHHGWQEIWKV